MVSEVLAWKTFLRLRRSRYYREPSFAQEIERFGFSTEIFLFGVEERDHDGKTRDPASLVPTTLSPPLLMTPEEETLLREASIQILWE